MKAAEFFDLAVILHKNPEKTAPIASMRTCINRAYYSAFLVARDQAGIGDVGGSVHKEVANYYLSKDKTLSNRLKDLFGRRKDADYDLKKSFSDRDTGNALRMATEITTALAALKK